MIDIRGAAASVAISFDLRTSRAIQTAAPDFLSGQWYCAQGDTGTGGTEDALITRCAKPSKGVAKRVSEMLCIDADHPSTISVLRRTVAGKQVLGIVLHWKNQLGWVPYKAGKFTKTAAKFEPIFEKYGDFAYIDHENSTICFRRGASFRLYAINLGTGVVGKQIGKTMTGVDQSGPGQGFFTGKAINGHFMLFALFGYGHAHQKQTFEVRDFAKNETLYATTARVLPKEFTLQEPEGGYIIKGVPHLGMSSIKDKKKVPISVKLSIKPHILASQVKEGLTNSSIKAMQTALTKAGNRAYADGNYGPATKKAIIAYQTKKKLFVDGIAGPQTLKSLGFIVV